MIDMAAVIATADMTILKDTQILVNVEEALSDILVVSYSKEDKRFQGVLLDSTKRNLPYGVYSLHPAFTTSPKPGESNDDKLHSASQRFTYQEPGYARKPIAKSKPQARAKMTVRLRPRKVLCSKCKGICNENNENVDVGRKRKLSEQGSVTRDKKSVLIGSRTEENRTLVMRSTLIPKISRLHPNEISNAINGNVSGKNEVWIKSSDIKSDDDVEVVGSNKKNVQINNGHDSDVCPKKRHNADDASAETDRVTQELTFVNVSDAECGEGDDGEEYSASGAFSNTRTLKISFGEGEGTVLKIPAIVSDFDPNNEKAMSQPSTIRPKDSKAAKKALKKAKKQARKRVTLTPFTSPRPSAGGVSPRYIGALSPRYAATQDVFQRKHKHKVKHKKKHKVERKYGKDDGATKGLEVSSTDDSYAAIEKHCLKRKLSISLKRLSANSYSKNGTEAGERTSSESESEAWESEGPCDGVPAFPAAGGAGGGTGGEVREGDVVWGKVTGFPWWPGRVLAVRGAGEAHVAWYASNTSSLMPSHSLSPFLEDYKLRFNKKKRGPYKEAVKLATMEAQKERRDSADTVVQDPLASAGSVALPTVSPRPIDVLS